MQEATLTPRKQNTEEAIEQEVTSPSHGSEGLGEEKVEITQEILEDQYPIREDTLSPSAKAQQDVDIFELDKLEEAPEEQINRPSVYSPVKNRESFIDKKIKAINNNEEDFGRQSLDCVDFRPRLSLVGREQVELKRQREELEATEQKQQQNCKVGVQRSPATKH